MTDPTRPLTEPLGGENGGASPTDSQRIRAEAATNDPFVGKLFHGKYRIRRKIGSGGFGAVYEAIDERGAGYRVAIKILRPEIAALDERMLRDFRDEARRLTRLDHPNIVNWKVFDRADDGTLYLVMEFVEGEELDRVLARDGRLPAKRVAAMLLQMLDALRAAHHPGEGQGILHLDLKPKNVFVVPGARGGERIKLIDFGVGQFTGAPDEVRDVDAASGRVRAERADEVGPTTITYGARSTERLRAADGTPFRRAAACTPEYAAPEQCKHMLDGATIEPLDGRADLYSLGVMAFQMLTGRLPFARPPRRDDVLRQHVDVDAERVGAARVRVPRELARFIDRCLARDREKRFRDSIEAHAALERIVSPPAWKTTVKVVVPIVLVGALAAWRFWPASLAALEVRGADGTSLSRDGGGLWMGPDRPTESIAVQPTVGARPPSGTPVALVDARSERPLDGWAVQYDGERVELRNTAREKGKSSQRARLVLGELRSDDFALVWLGAEAWNVERVALSGRSLATDRATRVDPTDLVLQCTLRAPELDPRDVATVRARLDDAPFELPLAQRVGSDLVYAAALPAPSVRALVLTVEVVDSARRPAASTHALEVVTERLAFGEVDLHDGPSSEGRKCNQDAAGYALTAGTRPVLRATLARPARAHVEITIEGKRRRDLEPGARDVESELELPLDAFARALADAKQEASGTIALHADEGELEDAARRVLHAEGRARENGRRSSSFAFRFTARATTLEIRIDDGRGAVAFDPARPFHTKERSIALLLATDAPSSVGVSGSVRRASGAAKELPELADLRKLAGRNRSARLVVALDEEGDHAIELAAYACSSETATLPSRPEVAYAVRVVVDRTAPSLVVDGLAPDAVFRATDALPSSLSISDRSDARSSRSPLALAWRLDGPAGPGDEHRVDAADGTASSGDAELFLSGAPPDGRYRFQVSGSDAAGNEAETFALTFDVARQGPSIQVLGPRANARWSPDPDGRWIVTSKVTDANGVEASAVRCSVTAIGEPALAPREGVALTPVDGAADAYAGAFALDEDWSGRRVRVDVVAADELAVSSTARVEAQLGAISAKTHEWVVDAKLPTQRMRLVRGNRGSYLFGGRDAAAERDAFEAAGLAWTPELGKRFYGVEYSAREIGDFYLDEDEVSRSEFLAFVADRERGYRTAEVWSARRSDDADARADELERALAEDGDLPVAHVRWDEADAYARWARKRLPAWPELEYAARGGEGAYRPYAALVPGRASVRPRVNVAGEGAWARGAGDDASEEGLRSLAGNLAEWTCTPCDDPSAGPGGVAAEFRVLAARYETAWLRPKEFPGDPRAIQRYFAVGGSFAKPDAHFFVAAPRPRADRQPWLGFRCAADLDRIQARLKSGDVVPAEERRR